MKKESQFGIGVDIEDIGRFAGLRRAKDGPFLKKIFTAGELDYCFSKKNAAPHLAARFCAKEAVVKALHGVGAAALSYTDIEIVSSRKVPRVVLRKGSLKEYRAEISLSHSGGMAIAFALVRTR